MHKDSSPGIYTHYTATHTYKFQLYIRTYTHIHIQYTTSACMLHTSCFMPKFLLEVNFLILQMHIPQSLL